MCKVFFDVPFFVRNVVITNLVDELVIKFPSWNHFLSYIVLFRTSNSNQAELPSRSTKLLLLKWSIFNTSGIVISVNFSFTDTYIYEQTSLLTYSLISINNQMLYIVEYLSLYTIVLSHDIYQYYKSFNSGMIIP